MFSAMRLMPSNNSWRVSSLVLRTVGSHLSGAADVLLAAGIEVPREYGPHPPDQKEEAE